MAAPYVPRLARVPDARRSPWPVFDAVYLPYAALMVGTAPASLCALWNALGLRRWIPAVAAVLLGLASWVMFGVLVQLLYSGGVRNLPAVIILGRLLNLVFGIALAWSQWGYVRGHRFLGGALVPLLPSLLVTMAAVLLMPPKALVVLWGLWHVLLRG